MSTKISCSECIKKQEEIYRLREEIQRLKAKLRYQEQKNKQGYFGSSTPSSKKPIKKNTQDENPNKNGGAKKGHPGNGRSSFTEEEADRIEVIDCKEKLCSDCILELEKMGSRNRSVLGFKQSELEKILYKLQRCRCPRCKRIFTAQAPQVLPRFLLDNELLTHIACEHYIDGIPMGMLAKKMDINNGALFGDMHHLADLLKDIPNKFIEQYRQAPVKFADETSWRNDGQNGFSWLFSTPKISVYRFRPTRSSIVVKEVLGTDPLPGTLNVDRYNGYNKAPCKIQYCYEHLRRNIEDLQKEFPDNLEIEEFNNTVIPLLSEAMGLRSRNISDDEFYQQAKQLKSKIINEMDKSAHHAGIQNIQSIFRDYSHRLYHWADNRDVPADNNFSERSFRRLVISRKISFGSQSEKGAKTREIIMSVLHSLQKQYPNDYKDRFKACLNKLAYNPQMDPFKFLFPDDSS
jgi:transposase